MNPEIRVDRLLGEASRLLVRSLDATEARAEAEILLSATLGRARSWLFAFADAEVDAELAHQFRTLCERRAQGEPIAYLLGHREFWGMRLEVNACTLIPRHDTERLVELALERLPTDRPCQVLDLGTGSGAIALALASERPRARVLATDRSEGALEVARRNARALGLANVECVQSDWFDEVPRGLRFDLIVSNPPYIAEGDPHLGQGDCRHEPLSALVADAQGLSDLQTLVAQAPQWLTPGAWLLLEHGWDQAAAVRALLGASGLIDVASWQDLAGVDRVSGGRSAGD
jgi:release factor glutamine methyltransferase